MVPGTNVWNVTAAEEFHQVGLKHLSSSLICCVCQAGLFPWSRCCFACTQLFLTLSRSLQIYIFWIYFCILSHRKKKKKKPSHQMTLFPPSSLHPAQSWKTSCCGCLSLCQPRFSFFGLDVSVEVDTLTSLHPATLHWHASVL